MLPTICAAIVVVGLLIALRPGGDPDRKVASANHGSKLVIRQVPRPVTGRPLVVTTPEGGRYRLAVARGGVDAAPLSGMPAPPAGRGYAFIDYVLTNEGREPALLDFPANVFLKRLAVPPDFVERCVNQVGAAPDMCDVPGRSKVIGRIEGSAGLLRIDGDAFMPGGASYLVRAVADAPVDQALLEHGMALYVWEVRFTRDRVARNLPFPAQVQGT